VALLAAVRLGPHETVGPLGVDDRVGGRARDARALWRGLAGAPVGLVECRPEWKWLSADTRPT